MIIDSLENSKLYYGIGQRIAAGLEFLQKQDFTDAKPARYEIDGDNLFYLVQEYTTKPQVEGKWEAHHRYIDIQYVVKGEEIIGYAPIKSLSITEKYDEAKDILFLEGQGSFLKVKSGCFAIFGPDDAHMPCIASEEPSRVKKIVMKVLI